MEKVVNYIHFTLTRCFEKWNSPVMKISLLIVTLWNIMWHWTLQKSSYRSCLQTDTQTNKLRDLKQYAPTFNHFIPGHKKGSFMFTKTGFTFSLKSGTTYKALWYCQCTYQKFIYLWVREHQFHCHLPRQQKELQVTHILQKHMNTSSQNHQFHVIFIDFIFILFSFVIGHYYYYCCLEYYL